ncbi:uncharacterized protein LOC129266577 [Lytechinus pictus]|uniref:uncharacterized protein LOC129266577 n=1 Tax=Lytechinus pictus TaxID=7653 RepID=UPI0030BA1D33
MEDEDCETEYPKDFTTNRKLHRAARKGNVRKLRKLCKSGVNPDAVNEQCQSPLFVAALHNREKAVQFLISTGADPNHACYDGSTPMHAACLSCSPSILCILADAGGNINHHDNRGLHPRDWISYQEEIDKRFKMRKFLEAMKLYAVGTAGDEKLRRTARSRWDAFTNNIQQFPERRGRQWRRRRWFTDSPEHRFRPRVPESVTTFFRRLRNIDWTMVATCFRFVQHEEVDITQRDTLRSKDVMKVQMEPEKQAEAKGCKVQLSDSTYPVLTLYVDEKHGKLTSTKEKEDLRHHDLMEITEEFSSPGQGDDHLKDETGDGNLAEKGKMPSAIDFEGSLQGLQNGHVGRGVTDDPPRVDKKKSPAISACKELSAEKYDPCHESERDTLDDDNVDRSSTSSDDSCKNRMMEILEDAFKLELAPKVSALMADYCDSTQGSNAAQESFDVDFQSYHDDDPDEVDVDAVKRVGNGEVGGNLHQQDGPCPAGDPQEGDNHRDDFEAGEIKIDGLMLKDVISSSSDDDEDDRNFIKEGRYIDVQKMLTANLEMVFPETVGHSPTSPCDLNNNTEARKHQEDGKEGDVTAGSSLYQVSALNDAAFISDLSLEVNVNESIKLSLESVPQPQEGNDVRTGEGDLEEGEDDPLGDKSLHLALAKLDLTQAEKDEVQEWFGGHGSVRNLIHNYESKIQEIQCETLRSNVTSLGALLRREYGMLDQGNAHDARRCVSDTAALHRHQPTEPHATTSECPRVMPSQDTRKAPPVSVGMEMDSDDSWLWPASGEEDATFEEQLRWSMEVIGLEDDDGETGAESGRGDADKQLEVDQKRLVSPPPPTCTPEEHSPRPIPDTQADNSAASHVNNSGDCETTEETAAVELRKALTPPFPSPATSPRAEAELTSKFSPPSVVGKKLIKIDVMRSPTVEAIQNTSD